MKVPREETNFFKDTKTHKNLIGWVNFLRGVISVSCSRDSKQLANNEVSTARQIQLSPNRDFGTDIVKAKRICPWSRRKGEGQDRGTHKRTMHAFI